MNGKNGIKHTAIEGDVSVGRDLYIGGGVMMQGDQTVKGDLNVNGHLFATHVESACKGLFKNVEELQRAYPEPKTGWWALVGYTVPAPVYIVIGGRWTNKGKSGGATVLNSERVSILENQLTEACAEITRLKQRVADCVRGDAPTDGRMYVRQDGMWEELPIEDMMSQLPFLTFKSISGGGVFEKGSKVAPVITWAMEKAGVEVNPDAALVNGQATGVSDDKKKYEGGEIGEDTSYVVGVEHGGKTVKRRVDYTFRAKKYWGVSDKPELESADLFSLESAFALDQSLQEQKFDCKGGRYVYYAVPANLCEEGIIALVGGLCVTDIVVKDLVVTNNYGHAMPYKVFRLGNIQHGALYIGFA